MLQDIWRFINFTIGEQISEISNGFIALAGYKKQGYGTTTLALRLNPSGDTVCSRIFDIPEQNGPSALFTPIIAVVLNTQPDDGGYLDLCLLKTDSMFNVLWSKVYDFNDMLLLKKNHTC
jgi:hypothetical protein